MGREPWNLFPSTCVLLSSFGLCLVPQFPLAQSRSAKQRLLSLGTGVHGSRLSKAGRASHARPFCNPQTWTVAGGGSSPMPQPHTMILELKVGGAQS